MWTPLLNPVTIGFAVIVMLPGIFNDEVQYHDDPKPVLTKQLAPEQTSYHRISGITAPYFEIKL